MTKEEAQIEVNAKAKEIDKALSKNGVVIGSFISDEEQVVSMTYRNDKNEVGHVYAKLVNVPF